ncbi:hypothetical protein BHE74_00016694 [Ensete ventricosum]|nr:hypothetical protein BHE74_00016694 [Ensete ventricosum]RZR77454.1 hypothetical protein BHM03_00002542 [Ensete ventricosum]
MHLSLHNAASSDLLLPSSLIVANSDTLRHKCYQQQSFTAICLHRSRSNLSLPTALIAASIEVNMTNSGLSLHTIVVLLCNSRALCCHVFPLLQLHPCYNSTCSHEVAPQPATPKLSPPPTVIRHPQPEKLTREDPHDESAKGLCGCCDKLWSLKQDCKMERPLMIVATEEPKLEDTALEPMENDTPQSATRTVPTLTGYTNPQKLKIEGFLEQQSVIILIDARSTHNFMSSKFAAHLMLQNEDYSGFDVKVANGQILKCNQKCPRVKLILQEQDVVADFFLLPLNSFDIVLGIDWLSTIGDDF